MMSRIVALLRVLAKQCWIERDCRSPNQLRQPCRHVSIHTHYYIIEPCPITSTGIEPIGSKLNQVGTDWIQVQVVNRFVNCHGVNLIAIVAWSGLPEVAVGTVLVDNGELLEKCRCMQFKIPDCLLAHRLLDGLQNIIYLIDRLSGTDQ